MKKFILILVFIIFSLSTIRAQITHALGELLITDTLELNPLHPWIEIPDAANNIWQVGTPQKTFFNAPYQNETPILTDTLNSYPVSVNQYFQITIPLFDHFWGEVNLSFYHKFDTDTLLDGGIIEISYDSGISWTNIKYDTLLMLYNFINIPQDTILGGEYGFSGRSNGWQYTELYWQWLILVKDRFPMENPIIRFRFVSDNIQTNKEGWMIDHIVFRGYRAFGNVDDMTQNNIKIYPNPTFDNIIITSATSFLHDADFILYDLNGKEMCKTTISDNQKIQISHLQSGIYFYKLIYNNEIQTGKIIKQ